MMLNTDEEKALYPVLRHYTGVDIQDVSISVNGYDFLTVLGDYGQIQKSESGDWGNLHIGPNGRSYRRDCF